jgi:hypothetical protein
MATKKAKPKGRKPRKKPLDWAAIYTRRGKALSDLESEVCSLLNFGEIAFYLVDEGQPGLYDEPVDHLVNPSSFFIRMHPLVRRVLARFPQFDHAHRGARITPGRPSKKRIAPKLTPGRCEWKALAGQRSRRRRSGNASSSGGRRRRGPQRRRLPDRCGFPVAPRPTSELTSLELRSREGFHG